MSAEIRKQPAIVVPTKPETDQKVTRRTILLAFIAVALIIGGVFSQMFLEIQARQELVTVENANISTYYSKGSRDSQRYQNNEFRQNDPIQIAVSYKKARPNSEVQVVIYDQTGEKIFDTGLKLSPDTSSQEVFVTVPNQLLTSDAKYTVELTQAGYVLASSGFYIQPM